MLAFSVALSVLAALPATQAAMGCGGHELGRRNLGGPVITERQVAYPTVDAAAECKFYTYAPTAGLAPKYPAIWQPATIVQGDAEATSLFQTINQTLGSKFASVAPKGNGAASNYMGNFDGLNYPANDPDCWWTRSRCTTPAADTNLVPDLITVPEPQTWGFGFDDGPNCSHNAFYEYLQQQNQLATMFFIGSNVIDWPVQAIQAIKNGHHICVHTWSHRYLTQLSNEQAFAELYYTRKIIKDVMGVTPKCWRPPFGDVDNRIRFIAESLNLTNIVWSHDTFDWEVGSTNTTEADVANNYNAVINNASDHATSGPIVLTHEINNFTMNEMVKQYPAIKAAFKNIVPIASAMNWTVPYVEENVTYPSFEEYVAGGRNGSTKPAAGPTAGTASGGSGPTGSNAAAASSSKPASAMSVAAVPASAVFVALGALAVLL